MEIYYVNSQGEKLDLITYPYLMLADTDLFNYTWKNTTKGTVRPKISSFSKSMVPKKFSIRVKGASEENYRYNIEYLTSFFDADVLRLSPGRLYVGNYYLDCYIYASSKPNKYLEVLSTTVDFTLVSPDGNWKTSNIFHYGTKGDNSDTEVSDGTTNLALRKPVTASGYGNPSFMPSNSVDGYEETFWASEYNESAWLVVDLGNSYYLSKLSILWKDSYAVNYDILVSNDNKNWINLKQMRNMSGGRDEIILQGTYYFRYVKFQGIKSMLEYGYKIYEFEVYGTSVSTMLDYPLEYLYDYTLDTTYNSINNDGYADSDFEITIYGKCENPVISIGDWNYGVNDVELLTGEKLVINSVTKKVYKVQNNGNIVNLFNNRFRDFYAFQKIPAGVSVVGWSGAYSFDVELFENRSEPKWT